MRIYMDNCCFNRPFDDQSQLKLKLKGIKSKDALHIACAIFSKSDYFITTDDSILKKLKDFDEINIIDPINFIRSIQL